MAEQGREPPLARRLERMGVNRLVATLVIIGSAETRVIERPGLPPLVYAPRSAGGA